MKPESADELVAEIFAINEAWKSMQELLGPAEPATLALRDLKSALQASLLRGGHGFLQEDSDGAVDLWSVRLSSPSRGRRDACHLPKDVADRVLTPDELVRFTTGPE